MSKITPFLWFDSQAEDAANFYVSIFKNSKINTVVRYDEASAEAGKRPINSVLTISFELNGVAFTALNGGPIFEFTGAISFVINCDDQDEIDYFWDKLSADPEFEQCGWLKDKFGISWQVVPKNMSDLVSSPGAMKAMLKMKKINIKELQDANKT